jgi:hypothetical protein
MAGVSLVFSAAEADAKATKKHDNPFLQNLGFAYFKGSTMDCKQFFVPKKKGELVKGIAEKDQPTDIHAILLEFEAKKPRIAFQITAKAIISVTLKDKTVVTSTKDVRVVITNPKPVGPNCLLYFVQVYPHTRLIEIH